MRKEPCDWDGDSYCCRCHQPATHRKLTGMIDATPLFELVCCRCATVDDTWRGQTV